MNAAALEVATRRVPALRVVILGLSITSSWGNGHATTYRALVKALTARGHEVLFLERDASWYAAHRDLPAPPYGVTRLYSNLEELKDCFGAAVRSADLVVVGSYVPDGTDVGAWVIAQARGITAFYDIDTPVTLSKLAQEDHEYLSPALIPQYDLYLSFTGGPLLARLQRDYHAKRARPLYCSVDPELYYPEDDNHEYDLGYLGTYSSDRQPPLETLLLEPARQLPLQHFVVAGPQYPKALRWPPNVRRIEHLSPSKHRSFYNAQRFTLNVTRAAMARAGYSPSVRLFEAAACGVPVVSDAWVGLDEFFTPDEEIFVCRSTATALQILGETREHARCRVGERARQRVLRAHTPAHRAQALERYVDEVAADRTGYFVGADSATRL
jgi:spore maturation protein CgeB